MKKYRDFKDSLIETVQDTPDEIGVVGIREELYDLIPESTVVGLVNKHRPNTKITNTMLENYIGSAKAQNLTSDRVVKELRKLNPADSIFEAHVEYRLQDGQVVVISEEMDDRLNKLLSEHPVVLTYMSESVGNFMDVVNELEE